MYLRLHFLTCLNTLEQSPLDISEGPSLHDAMGIVFWRHNAPWDWKNKLGWMTRLLRQACSPANGL